MRSRNDENLGSRPWLPLLALVLVAMAGASISVQDPGSRAAIPVLGTVALLMTLTVLRMIPDAQVRRDLSMIVLAGVALRLIIFAGVRFTVGPYAFAPDAWAYEIVGSEIVQSWDGLRELPTKVTESLQVAYYYLNAVIQKAFGSAPSGVAVLNVFMGAWIAAPVYYLTLSLVHGNRGVARWAAGLTAFFPSLVLWSVLNVREAPTILFIVLAVFLGDRIQRRFGVTTLLALALCTVAIVLSRQYLAPLILGSIMAGLLLGRGRGAAGSLAAGLLLLAGVGVVIGSGGIGVALGTEPTLDSLEYLRQAMAGDAASAYGSGHDVSTTRGAIRFLPVGLAYYLFAPFPWQSGSMLQAVTLPEVLLWYSLVPFTVLGFSLALRNDARSFVVVLSVLVTVTFAYALVQGNVGTAFRHRAQVLPFFFLFSAIGLRDVYGRLVAKRKAHESTRRQILANRPSHDLPPEPTPFGVGVAVAAGPRPRRARLASRSTPRLMTAGAGSRTPLPQRLRAGVRSRSLDDEIVASPDFITASESEGHAWPSRPRRVLVVVDSLRRGGAERLIVTTLEHLDRSRFEPCVVSLFGPGPLSEEIRSLGIDVVELNLAGPSHLLRAVSRLRALIRNEAIDVVHTHLFFSNISGRIAAGRRVPVVTTLHNPDYGQEGPAHGFGLRRMIDGSTAHLLKPKYLAVSQDVERDYRRHLALEGVQVLYNYMDVEAFQRRLETVDRVTARRSLGITDDEWAILHTGRLHRQKGQDVLIDAFVDLKARVPNAVLLLAGEGPDLSDIVDRVGELGLAGSIRLLGDVKDVTRLYAAADAFAFPSRYEAFGISLLEAMGAGLPCVVSAVGGIIEVAAPDSVLFVPPEDPDALACALARLAGDPELSSRLGERARVRAMDFDVSVWVPKLEGIYAAA